MSKSKGLEKFLETYGDIDSNILLSRATDAEVITASLEQDYQLSQDSQE